ncbi:hypothetical protein [Candidatus Magnetaquicoccus inordinatus]|uniref:hypothetical protein n=1 Tax=Candidatus Magnetaquicoccus inordinatus TaxID=2496818 RepID=UPI001290C67B|nr:hypothetical protein [Candidatus Magnetaquicoccus inordinatus]
MKRLFRCRFVAILLCCFVPTLLWGGESTLCPPATEGVKIQAQFATGRPFIDDHRSQGWIQEQSKGMHHPIGLTVSRLQHTLLGVFEWRATAEGEKRCLYLRSLRLDLSYPDLKVYIANNYRPGSCEYQAIYRHEMEHVRILNQHQEGYVQHLRDRLQSLAQKQKAVVLEKGMLEQKKQEILQRLDQEVKRELQRLDTKQKTAQAEIDTPRSYAQVRADCQRW